MSPHHDDICHCPQCDRRTRHSIVRERVLAPVLWCLSCFRTRVEGLDQPSSMVSISKGSMIQGTKVRDTRAKRSGASVAR